MKLIDRMSGLQLAVIGGKGGVGKTTLAAALGKCIAAAGKRVLLLETDPRESLYQVFGVPPSGGEIVRVDDRLYLQNLRPRVVLNALVREKLRVGLLVDRVLKSPIYDHFAEGAPGLKEMAVLYHALRTIDGHAGSSTPEFDQVVLDAPATGHGTSLLAAPGLVADVIQDGPIGRAGGELAEFVRDPQRLGVALVTLAEEMPVQETVEHIEELERSLNRRPEAVFVNGLYPARAAPSVPPGDDVFALWQMRRAINDRQLTKLSRGFSGPRVELPLMPLDRGVDLVHALSASLARGMTVDAWT